MTSGCTVVLNLVIFIREISKIHNTYLYGVDFSIVVVLGVVRTKFVFTNIGKYKPWTLYCFGRPHIGCF